MSGILTLWNDCAPGAEAEYERWYGQEHLPERLAVPGFRSARRYEAFGPGPRYFTWYEVDAPAVLDSAAYLALLSNPTPWTQRIMASSFRAMNRTVCERVAAFGGMSGAQAVTLRLDRPPATGPATNSALAALAGLEGVARVQLWSATPRQSPADTAEAALRGGADAQIGGALVVECLRPADARACAERLGRDGPPPALVAAADGPPGLYALLCAREAAR